MFGYILQRNYRGKIVSYETQKLLHTADEMGWDLSLHDPYAFDVIADKENKQKILLHGNETFLPDFIFPRMGATTPYFAMALIRQFEEAGVFTVNSSRSIEMVKDKLFQMQVLANHNVPVPRTILSKSPVDEELIEQKLGFPVVIKTLSGSQGSGVFLANDKNTFSDFMKMMHSTNSETHLIMQEFIESSKGRDLRVYVLGDKALGAMQRSSNDDSFKANFSRGGSVLNYPITDQIEEMCVNITKIFKLDIAGVDLLFDKDGNFKVCEVNSSPGFKGMELATGKNIAKEVLLYIQNRAV